MNPWHGLILVLGTAGTALMARALPWPKAWLDVKPLACAACMSGWSAFAVMGLGVDAGWLEGFRVSEWILGWLALLPVSAVVFRTLYPPAVDIRLPDEETSGVES
jgi:hypothetical protein